MPSNNAYGYSSEEVYEPLDNELLDSSGGMGAALGDTLRGAWDDPLGSALDYGKGAALGAGDLAAMLEPLANKAFPIRFHETKKGIAERVDALAEDFASSASNKGAVEAGRLLGTPQGFMAKILGGLGGLATIFPPLYKGSQFFVPTAGTSTKIAQLMKSKKLTQPEAKSIVRAWEKEFREASGGRGINEIETTVNPTPTEFLEWAEDEEEFVETASKLYRILEDENKNIVIFDAKIVHDQARGPLDIYNSNPYAHKVFDKNQVAGILKDPHKFKAEMNLKPRTGLRVGNFSDPFNPLRVPERKKPLIDPTIPKWNR